MRITIAIVAAAILTASVFAAAPAVTVTELESQISAKLIEAFGDDAKSIRVAVVEGKATLLGRVVERSTQELAEEVALYFPEVGKVDNQLKADKDRNLSEGQLSDEAADANLERQVKTALGSEIGSHAKDIEVEVADGFVSLRGSVPDDVRLKLALDAAKGTNGVRKVIDLLRVSK